MIKLFQKYLLDNNIFEKINNTLPRFFTYPLRYNKVSVRLKD